MKILTWMCGLSLLSSGAQALAVTGGVTWVGDNQFQAASCDEACDVGCCDGVDCGDGCDCGAGVCGRGGVLGAIEGFTLAGLLGLDDESWLEIGGWTNMAYYDNQIPLSQATDDLLSFDDVPDQFNLAQQWLYIGHTADGSDGLDIGGRIDVVYGTDAQKTQAFGNPNAGIRNAGSFDASMDHGVYGWAIPQAYGEFAIDNLSVKVGHFFTLVGYEVVTATGNFFHSHSYTMFNSEPFTHTGALATYAASENLSVMAGWVLGWDTGFDQLNSGNALHSGFAYTITEGLSFTYMNTYGNFGWRDGGSDNSYSHSCVLVADLTDKLQYVAQSDMVRTDNFPVSNFDTVGLNQYLFYNLSDLIGLGGRIEWWKADGVSFYEATSGVNIHVLDNLVFRPEYRQDWAPGIGLDEDTVAIDAILTY